MAKTISMGSRTRVAAAVQGGASRGAAAGRFGVIARAFDREHELN